MAKRTDSNQTEIVKAFRAAGALVHITSDLGKGFPDLVVGIGSRLKLVEIKDGSKPPSHRCLTPDEKRFHALWEGFSCIVYNVDDVINLINSMKSTKKPLILRVDE